MLIVVKWLTDRQGKINIKKKTPRIFYDFPHAFQTPPNCMTKAVTTGGPFPWPETSPPFRNFSRQDPKIVKKKFFSSSTVAVLFRLVLTLAAPALGFHIRSEAIARRRSGKSSTRAEPPATRTTSLTVGRNRLSIRPLRNSRTIPVVPASGRSGKTLDRMLTRISRAESTWPENLPARCRICRPSMASWSISS